MHFETRRFSRPSPSRLFLIGVLFCLSAVGAEYPPLAVEISPEHPLLLFQDLPAQRTEPATSEPAISEPARAERPPAPIYVADDLAQQRVGDGAARGGVGHHAALVRVAADELHAPSLLVAFGCSASKYEINCA